MIQAIIEGFCSPAFKKETYELRNFSNGCYVSITVATGVGKDKQTGKNKYNYVTCTLWNNQATDFINQKPRIVEITGKLQQENGFLKLNGEFWKEIKEFKKQEFKQEQPQKTEQGELQLNKPYVSENKTHTEEEDKILWD